MNRLADASHRPLSCGTMRACVHACVRACGRAWQAFLPLLLQQQRNRFPPSMNTLPPACAHAHAASFVGPLTQM